VSCFHLSAFSVVGTSKRSYSSPSVQVTFAVVGAGVIEICSVSNVDFAPDGFKAECCMREEMNAAAFDYGSPRPQKGET
jgi:hypothetical protein